MPILATQPRELFLKGRFDHSSTRMSANSVITGLLVDTQDNLYNFLTETLNLKQLQRGVSIICESHLVTSNQAEANTLLQFVTNCTEIIGVGRPIVTAHQDNVIKITFEFIYPEFVLLNGSQVSTPEISKAPQTLKIPVKGLTY